MSRVQEYLDSSNTDLLRNIFEEIDSNKDKGLTFEELGFFLSKKSGKPFNSELLAEIFRTIDHDRSSLISLNEFISGYSKAESLIKSQIFQLKSQIADNSEGLLKAQKGLIEAKSQKIHNKAENNLYVTVKKCEGLKAGGVTGNKAPIVCIVCEENEIQTVPIPNPSNPEWNQSFTFPISQGFGDVLIEVYDTDRGKKSNFLGQVKIPLRALANQELHEDFLTLTGKNNEKNNLGMILVALQWIYDLETYLESMVKQYEEAIKEDKAELESLEGFLKELKAPIEKENLPDWVRNNKNIEKIEGFVSENIQNLFENTAGKKIMWPQLTLACVLIFLIFSTCNMVLRPDFFNVICT